METIEHRMQELKRLGAGDSDCTECIDLGGMQEIETCQRCISDTPVFSDLVGRLIKGTIKPTSNSN